MAPANMIGDSDKQKRQTNRGPQSSIHIQDRETQIKTGPIADISHHRHHRRWCTFLCMTWPAINIWKRGKVAIRIENSADNWKHLEGCPPPCHGSHIWNQPRGSLSTTEVWPCHFFSRSYISHINYKSFSWKMSRGIKRTIEEWIIHVTLCSF